MCAPFTSPHAAYEEADERDDEEYADYEYGDELSLAWAEKAPEALEIRAWGVANASMLWRLSEVAWEMAEEMRTTDPDSPWTAFAIATAGFHSNFRNMAFGNREAETVEASKVAMASLP